MSTEIGISNDTTNEVKTLASMGKISEDLWRY
jgi:hypothetical protein